MYDQLNKIWAILGTPSEATWPGVSNLPEHKPCEHPVLTGAVCSCQCIMYDCTLVYIMHNE